MDNNTIEIPTNINGFRIKHLAVLDYVSNIKDIMKANISDKVMVNSLFTGIDHEDMRQFSIQSQNLLFSQIIRTFDTYIPHDHPPHSFTFKNQKYNLVKDFSRMPAGWFVDISRMDFKKFPEQLAAMCYIEDGMVYAQMDENKNILNLSTERAKVFAEHMPLNKYKDLTNFFLRVWVMWKGESIQKEKIKNNLIQMKSKLSRLNGRMQAMK